MPLGLAFWILMLLWLVLGIWTNYPFTVGSGRELLLFLLIGILGWHSFGPPLHG